jgi:hypothetical protein
MANHAYIELKEKISEKELHETIKQIVDSRFKGYFKVEAHKDLTDGKLVVWVTIKEPKVDWIDGYETVALYFINEDDQIEMRHGHGDFGWWAENVINHDLFSKFNITEMEDDGIGKFDVSNHKIYESYEAYQRHHWIGMRPKKERGLKNKLKKRQREKYIKDEVKDGAKVSDVFSADFKVGPSPWEN